MKIKDVRSLPAAAREAIRHRAAAAALNGMKQVEVVRLFGSKCSGGYGMSLGLPSAVNSSGFQRF